MLANFHTHTTFCDGKSTVEEVVLSALEKGFSAIGFSGHAYTAFDLSYCMKDTDLYLAEIRRVKEKYGKEIEIYAGVEEDAFYPQSRGRFDYILGSSHYFHVEGQYFPVDNNIECMKKCLSLYHNDTHRMAEDYYSAFCTYLLKYRPDIVGHFDLLTKFDEKTPIFMHDPAYCAIAERYLLEAIKCGGIFEVNTGAISRGYRTAPYPSVELLHILKREGARVMITSDSHHASTIDCAFDETRALLRDVGFRTNTVLYHGEFIDDVL